MEKVKKVYFSDVTCQVLHCHKMLFQENNRTFEIVLTP